ncbi:MAG: tetratricopeptide repeat protein [Alphaproteobacteria bacterium]|nr:tetratricopeptide repeat protein [Alphaproteobacteria bacterium]
MPAGVSEDVAALADTAAQLLQAGDFPAGLRACRAALALAPEQADLLHMHGLALAQSQSLPAAAILLGRATMATAAPVLAARHLAAVFNALGRRAEEAEAHRTILRTDPYDVVALGNLGAALLATGRASEAALPLQRAVVLNPGIAELAHNLAEALAAIRKHTAALRHERRALAIRAAFPEALNGLGLLLRHLNQPGEAIACFERAAALSPDYAEAQNNFGNALHVERRIAAAVTRYRRSLALKPAGSAPHMNLGNARMDRGDPLGAVANYRRALAIAPDNAACDTALVFALDFREKLGFAEQQAERRRWYRRHALPFAAMKSGHANDRTPDRRLKVGFVSADFRQHATASIFGPVLRRLDATRFEIGCYSATVRADWLTESFRRISSFWRETHDLSPTELAAQIRRDEIDILVDLSGHTGGHRLQTFAAKPAPVQITAWGHGVGTGVPEIDYFLGDPVLLPPAIRPLLAEQVYDLPCFMTSEPPEDAPTVAAADPRRPFTLGCFNRASKISGKTAAAWGHILAALPAARLLLKDPSFDDGLARAEMSILMARHGVAPARVEMRGRTPRTEHMGAFADVDLALDPFPFNGGVSTFEAVHMGVPVIALLGSNAAGRASAAILSAIGLADWIAADVDAYVALAIAKAQDRAALASLRPGFREQLAQSAVGDLDRYTAAVADGFRVMWRRWCES